VRVDDTFGKRRGRNEGFRTHAANWNWLERTHATVVGRMRELLRLELDAEKVMSANILSRLCFALAISFAIGVVGACAKSGEPPLKSNDSSIAEAGIAEGGVVEAGAEGGSGDSGAVSGFCEMQACGTVCPCTSMNGNCYCDGDGEKSVCACNAGARCVAKLAVVCSGAEYEPCRDQACGATCSPCEPGSPGCAPTEPHYCDGDRFCKRQAPSCD
jgi:hypothetical protein